MKGLKRFTAIVIVMILFINTLVEAKGIEICYDGGTHLYTGEIYKLYVNGKEISSPMEPIIFNDHALVPVREVFEECGATVDYIEKTRTVKVNYGTKQITMHINNNCAYINGQPVAIPDGVVPKLIYKPGNLTKTMVPVRFISESVGMKVDFDGDKGEIRITEPKNIPTPAPTQKPQPQSVDINSIESKLLSSTTLKVTVNCTGDAEGLVSHFSLTGPERVVVDFKGMKYSGGDKTTTITADGIKSVRTGVDNQRTRVVIDIDTLKTYSVDINGTTVVILVSSNGGGTTNPATPAPTQKPASTPKPTATPKPTPKPTLRPMYATSVVPATAEDANKIIMLDAGHGGTDPGAIGELNGQKIYEKTLTLSITKKVKSILDSNGYKTAMTRTGDTLPSLSERPQMANNKNCTLFTSIHINSAVNKEAKGTEVYYSEENNGNAYGITSWEFASYVQKSMIKYMKSVDRGVQMANWAVIRRSKMPAVLIEVGFISNEAELLLMNSEAYQNKVATGIAEGIINTLHYAKLP